MKRLVILGALLCSTAPVLANVPVRDSALLDRRTTISGNTTQTKEIQSNLVHKRKGVNCAVREGQKKTDARDPNTVPQKATGTAMIERAVPGSTAAPSGGNAAANGTSQAVISETSEVVASSSARSESLGAMKNQYEGLQGVIGQTDTVKAALDDNSTIRSQNGVAWVQTTESANAWVRALNVMNLFRVALMSSGSGSLTVQPPISRPPTPTISACPAGMTGAGTSENPCVSTACNTTAYGVTPDPACVSRRYVDTTGNVLTFLARQQDQTGTYTPTGPALWSTTTPTNTVSAEDVQRLLSQYQNQ